jgi:hypothetical protein
LLTALAVASMAGTAVLAQKKDEKKRSKQEQQEIDQLVKLVDDVMGGQPAPTDVQMAITPYFLKSQDERAFVPFVLAVTGGPATDAAMFIRVANTGPAAAPAAEQDKDKDKDKNKPKRIEYPWEDVYFMSSGQMSGGNAQLNRVFMAKPGTYDVYIALKERLPEKAPKTQMAKTGVMKTQVTVPDFHNGELATSSIIVTDKVTDLTAPLNAEESRERPFVFGAQEFTPAVDMSFAKGDELSIFFQLYNAGLDANGKPDLTMEYSFHRKEEGVEKFFNKTNPQTINGTNLPPQFDPVKFPVPGGIAVPLTSFGPGEYRLEIKITDKAAKKELTHDVRFTVTAS